MSPSPTRPGALSITDALMLTAVFAGVVGSLVLWAGAAITAVLSGHPVPEVNPVTDLLALAEHSGNPATAWGQPVGPAWLYWASTASVIVAPPAILRPTLRSPNGWTARRVWPLRMTLTRSVYSGRSVFWVGLQRFGSERHRRVVTGEELSDTDLLVLSRTRPEMLGVIYERHAPAVYRYLGRRVGVRAAEDLLGEVFVAAVGARLRVRPHESGSGCHGSTA